MKNKLMASLLAATIIAGAGTAMAETTTTTQTTTVKSSTTATPVVTSSTAVNSDVKTAADNAPVMLTGTVKSINDDEFVLSYGSGEITVEMDDWRWDGDNAEALRIGERVTVTGNIDDDLFEGREIEANNIYVNSDNVYYYRENAGVAPMGAYGDMSAMADGTFVTMSGRVTEVDGKELTLVNKSNMPMQVDLGQLSYNPMDGDGVQQIREGDNIQVYGEIDEDFFETKEIVASRVVSMMAR
jgi:uncharacterized protein (TIGR00156 family)